MPKGDPAGYLPNVQAARKKKKRTPSKKGKKFIEDMKEKKK
jgi:hypothetical protein